MGFAIEKTYTAKTIERKIYKLSIKNFNSFKRQVMKNLKKADKTFNKHLKKQMPLAAIDIIMPDIGDVQHKWENTFEPFFEEEYQEVGNTALRKLRKRTKKYQYETKEAEDIFNVANPMTSQTIKNQVNKIVGASDRVYNKLKDEMMVDLLNGENIQKLQDTVTTVMNKTPMEAMRIARTESNRVANLGAYHSYETEDLVMGYEWLAIIDDNTRDAHRELNGERIKKGESFSNGMIYPLDEAAGASEVVNCRCTALPLLDEKEIAEGLPEEVVAVEAPQVKPTGAGATWNTTNKAEAKWHKKAGWGDKTKDQKNVRAMVVKSDPVEKVTRRTHSRGFYQSSTGRIEMGKNYNKDNLNDLWRHEFAHSMDNNPKYSIKYAQKVLDETGELPSGFGKSIFNTGDGLIYENPYLSFATAEDILLDRKLLNKQFTKSKKNLKKLVKQDAFGSVSVNPKVYENLGFKTVTDIDGVTRIKDLKKGFTPKKVRANIKKLLDEGDGFVKLEDLEELIGMRIDNKGVFKPILTNSNIAEIMINRIVRASAGGADDNIRMLYQFGNPDFVKNPKITKALYEKYKKMVGNLDDSLQAATRNAQGRVYYGHNPKYYTERRSVIYGVKEGQPKEIFAEYVQSLGLPDKELSDAFKRMYHRMLPNTSKKLDELIEFVAETDFDDWKGLVDSQVHSYKGYGRKDI